MQSGSFSNTFKINTYYHIVTVYDGDKVYGYVNGNLISSQDVDNGIKPYALIDYVVIGMSAAIGEHGYPQSSSDDWVEFKGIIDDVRIYNRALTASDVKDLYDSEKPVEDSIWPTSWTKTCEKGDGQLQYAGKRFSTWSNWSTDGTNWNTVTLLSTTA